MIAIFKKIASVSNKILNIKYDEKTEFAKSIKLLQQNIKTRASVFIISDFNYFDDNLKKTIAGLAKTTKVFMIIVFDVLAENAPKLVDNMLQSN